MKNHRLHPIPLLLPISLSLPISHSRPLPFSFPFPLPLPFPLLRSLLLLLPAIFASLASTPLAAQDVTVMPPALFDSASAPGIPNQPDTPPALDKNWSPVIPGKLRATTEPGYVIFTQCLDEKGSRQAWGLNGSDAAYCDRSAFGQSEPPCAPAQKDGRPAASWSWLAVLYNPASASEKNADATPRLLKVAPIFVTLNQWLAFPECARVVRGSVEIDAAGAAKNPKLESNLSHVRAVRPAIERSLPQWRFAPARKNGQPVATRQPINFVLQMAPNPKARDKQPEVVIQPEPVYPDSMMQSDMVGSVMIAFVVDANGGVSEPKVLSSSNLNFELPAIDAVLRWKFKPGTKDGVPVSTRMAIPVAFTLSDDDNPFFKGKSTHDIPRLTKEQIAQLPEDLRYDVAPKAYGMIYPVYPYEMLRDGRKGEATVEMLVDARGDIRKATVTQATAPEFGQAALAACDYFGFHPARLKGKPTSTLVTLKQQFDNNIPSVTAADRAMLRLEKNTPEKIIGYNKLDSKPKPVFQRQPEFPLAARQEKLTEGNAVVEFLIDTEGKVRLPRVVSATHPSFGCMAVQAVSGWRYEPPMSEGRPVVARARVPFNFSSKGGKAAGDSGDIEAIQIEL